MQPLVSLDGLTVAFNGVKVLDGISLSVGRGEPRRLNSETGSGKSVTWLAALGLLPKTAAVSGSVPKFSARRLPPWTGCAAAASR